MYTIVQIIMTRGNGQSALYTKFLSRRDIQNISAQLEKAFKNQ